MKILHINTYSHNFAGTERYLFDICRGLIERGNKVTVVSSTEGNDWPGILHYTVESSYGCRSAKKLIGSYKEIIKREDPDVIHLHNTQGYLSPFIIKYLLKIKPLVRTIHDSRLVCPKDGWKVIPVSNAICNYRMGFRCFKNGCYPFHHDSRNPIWNIHKFLLMTYEAYLTKRIDKLLVASSFMYNDLITNGFNIKNVSLIPLYTDKVETSESKQRDYDKKTILYASRVERLKGIMQFLESLTLLKSDGWQAEIIGKGPMEAESREFARQNGLADRVRFLGFVSGDEIDKHYEKSHIVVQPSMYPEPFGLVGIEAMAFGKPVVAFDSGGIKDWIVDSKTGFLVGRGKVRELSNRISQLLEDESLAESMGRAGKARVETLYRKDMHIKKLLSVYKEVIDQRKN